MEHFLQNINVDVLTLKQLMAILNYHNYHEVGSNLHNQVVDAICGFEIFLVGVSNEYYEDIILKDVLFSVASVAKIPPFP